MASAKWLLLVSVLWVHLAPSLQLCEVHLCSHEYTAGLDSNQKRRSAKLAGHKKGLDEEDQQVYCSLLNAYNQCMKTQSKSCRGNLEYHTVITLVRQWMAANNCSGSHHRSRQGMKDGSKVQAAARKEQEAKKRNENRQRKIMKCFKDAMNFTLDPTSFKKRSMSAPTIEANFDSLVNDAPVGSSSILELMQKDFVPLDSDFVDSHSLDTSVPNSDTDETSTEAQKEEFTCLIFGDPHMRTFNKKFQTCRCLGAWPLVEHPLFTVQITNSRLSDSNNISGITKVTVLIRRFGSCGLTSNLLYEAEATDALSNGQSFFVITCC